jgi:hypothetical protein
VQVVHKSGSSSHVPEEDYGPNHYGADHGEVEAAGGDGATYDAEGGDGATTKGGGDEEEYDGTPFEEGGEIDEGEENKEVLRQYKMEAADDELGLEEDSSDDEDESLVPNVCFMYIVDGVFWYTKHVHYTLVWI